MEFPNLGISYVLENSGNLEEEAKELTTMQIQKETLLTTKLSMQKDLTQEILKLSLKTLKPKSEQVIVLKLEIWKNSLKKR